MRQQFVCSAFLMALSCTLPIGLYAQVQNAHPPVVTARHPREDRLLRGRAFDGDVRSLPAVGPEKFERPELEDPDPHPVLYRGATANSSSSAHSGPVTSPIATPSAPAPAPSISFEGLDFANWGAGHPPDTNGDAGPQYYVQAINTSVGIYNKSDGSREAAFTFNSLMSQGNFGNLCDTNNFGDPIVLYDTFEDRWIITDFAFTLDGSGNVVAPTFQCFAVSKSGDPVAGGWNFYFIQINNALGDYPKFGIWTDGLYMSGNVFSAGANSTFQNSRVWAFNKALMYAGNSSVQVVSFDAPAGDFTILPSNARLQTGTPPHGSPNYFVSTWEFLNALTVYKFHVDWNSISLSTFSGPDIPIAATSWPNATPPNAPSLGGNSLDVLAIRAMVQNQYTNFGGSESLWTSHTVRRQNTSGFAAPRWYQVNVTGGIVAANLPQAATWDPDGANIFYRFTPSVAVDHAGDMAMGYSVSSSTSKPAIRYAGRLAGDPLNTFSQTEQLMIQGTGTQSGSCGGTCTRWGDYSAMTLDPDGCTFWYTAMYYQADGLAFNTRIAAFSFPSCTPIATGALQGTVTDSSTNNPIIGATVTLGSRTATTDINGIYSFAALPSGTYPNISASTPGYGLGSASEIVITDGNITTQDFSLTLAATSRCLTDTTQADFQAGVATNCDLTGAPGDVTLLNAPTVDQQNTAGTTTGTGFGTPAWTGQTFIPTVTANLVKVDVQLFCSGCTGTTPNLTLSVRATSAGLPTGADLATASIPGFSNSAGAHYTATFASPATLTSGTQYALILRPSAAPSAGGYFWIRSSPSTYSSGLRVLSSNSGATWSADSTRDYNFTAYMQTGYAASGNLVSSLKDANPPANTTSNWGTLTWTADTPANTSIQFQIAASNNASGPFSFVGPDGTSGTFFGNGDSLAHFNGNRYLKYQASFISSDPTATPVLHDVTICFSDLPATALLVAPATGSFGGTVNLNATLTSNSLGVPGKSVSFTLNGNNVGNGISDASGLTTVSSISLSGINAGVYPGGIGAVFAGDSGFLPASNTATLTVSKADQSIDFAVLSDRTFGDADFSVSASATSSLTVSFGAAGNCTITGSSVHLTGAGSCTVTASQAGDDNFNAATDVPQSFAVAKDAQTITFNALASKSSGDPDFSVSATASSALLVSFGASGSCNVTGTTVHISGAGSCTITASQTGDSDYNPATDVPQTFSITKGSQTITFGSLSGKLLGDPDFAVSATATSALTVSFSASGSCIVTGSTVHLIGAGNCTITAVQAGDSNYTAAPSVPQSFAIAKGNQAITFGALANEVFGNPDFAVAASASSSLAVNFSASGACSVAGSSVHLTGAGSCTITASQAGNANYNPAPDVSQAFSISKGLPIVTVSCPSPSFDAASHPCTATAKGAGNATVTGSSVFTYNSTSTPPINGGTYAVSASFTSSDNNYADAAGSGSLTISKATPTVEITCPAGVVYDGNVRSCTAATSGVGNATVNGSVLLTYNGGTAPASAGSYAVIATFTSGDSNYSNSAGAGSLTIARATQAITFSALPAKTLGDADFSVSATASSNLAVTFSASGTCGVNGTTVHLTGAGSCTVTASQAGNGNYDAAISVAQSFAIAASGDFTIAAKLPTISVTAGQQATDNVTITPNPSTLTPVTLTCSGLPAHSSCTFSPIQVQPGSVLTTVVVTINTTASSRAAIDGSRIFFAHWISFSGLGLIGMVFVGARGKNRLRVAMGTLALLFLLTSLGCGSGTGSASPGTAGTPIGTSIVTVTGATATFTHSTTIRLTVK